MPERRAAERQPNCPDRRPRKAHSGLISAPRRSTEEYVAQDWAAVAKAIDSRLAELGLRQQQLAQRAHVSLAIVRELQHNLVQRRRSARTLEALSLALEWHPRHLPRRPDRPDTARSRRGGLRAAGHRRRALGRHREPAQRHRVPAGHPDRTPDRRGHVTDPAMIDDRPLFQPPRPSKAQRHCIGSDSAVRSNSDSSLAPCQQVKMETPSQTMNRPGTNSAPPTQFQCTSWPRRA